MHERNDTSTQLALVARGLCEFCASRDCLTETSEMNFDKEYDASGLACPLPIVKTKKALSDMASGQVLRVISTDPGSVCDMAAFAEQTGNQLIEQGSEDNKYVFFLKKG
jgi:tRNA 2-thiouridine synthesizing protein A